jgi:hypothetical protein
VIASAQEKQEQSRHSFFYMDLFDYKHYFCDKCRSTYSLFDYNYYFCDECYFPKSTHNLTINLLVGVSKNQYGMVIGTLFNIIENNAYGIQIAGLVNSVWNQGKGLAVSGLINSYKSQAGVQIAGFNYAEKMRGVQIGFTNSSDDMQGVQIGFVNGIGTTIEEFQTVKGLQVGVVNMSNGGFQIGLCNISENNQYPLGLVNIIKNGEMNAGLAYDEIGNVTMQFRSGSRYLYGIVGLGYNTHSPYGHLVAQGGIGAHLNFSSKFRVDMEISGKHLTRTFIYFGDENDAEYKAKQEEFDYKAISEYSYGIFPSLKFSEKIELFAGPTLNYLQTNTLENKNLFPLRYIWRDFNSTSLKQLYIGYSVGLKYVIK